VELGLFRASTGNISGENGSTGIRGDYFKFLMMEG
jgi:hypothetical protein